MKKTKKIIPSFNPSATIRDWEEITFTDDLTVCVLCGKKEECECYDEFYCPCGKKNKDCDWPESIECPCRACQKIWVECLCDKPERYTNEEWLEIKSFKYSQNYSWKDNYKHLENEELDKLDEEEDK